MANYTGMIITNKGKDLRSKAESGGITLTFTKAKIGDGQISQEQTLEGLNDLVNPLKILDIIGIQDEGAGQYRITTSVTNQGLAQGFYVREIGLFADDPDIGEILYAISTTSSADYLPAEGGTTIVNNQFDIIVVTGNASEISAIIPPTGLVVRSEFDAHLADVAQHTEIEPDSLRENDSETDADLLQKAINLCDADRTLNKGIRIGRIYEIDHVVAIAGREPHIVIRNSGGGLKLNYDGYMFDGSIDNAGGLKFVNMKFVGSAFTHALFNCNNLIQILFITCDFYATYTILFSDSYIQSCKFANCNFKAMMDYQIKAEIAYDFVADTCLVEWGAGGFIRLTNSDIIKYCTFGLVISSCILEGITRDTPIVLTNCGSAKIIGNYFEGNKGPYDIDCSGGPKEHMGLTIAKNFFCDVLAANLSIPRVNVGSIYTTGANSYYDFTDNISTETSIFNFTSHSYSINMQGCKCINGSAITNLTTKFFQAIPSKTVNKFGVAVNDFSIDIASLSHSGIIGTTFYVEIFYNVTESVYYKGKVVGYLTVISGFTTTTQLRLIFNPIFCHTSNNISYVVNNTIDELPFDIVFESTQNKLRDTTNGLLNDKIIFKLKGTIANFTADGAMSFYVKNGNILSAF